MMEIILQSQQTSGSIDTEFPQVFHEADDVKAQDLCELFNFSCQLLQSDLSGGKCGEFDTHTYRAQGSCERCPPTFRPYVGVAVNSTDSHRTLYRAVGTSHGHGGNDIPGGSMFSIILSTSNHSIRCKRVGPLTNIEVDFHLPAVHDHHRG